MDKDLATMIGRNIHKHRESRINAGAAGGNYRCEPCLHFQGRMLPKDDEAGTALHCLESFECQLRRSVSS